MNGNHCASDKTVKEWPTWMTIPLGTGPTNSEDFCATIKKAGGNVSDLSRDIMDKKDFTVADQPAELDLVLVSVAELGFPNGANLKDIYDRAQKLGLSLCPAEVGPQLRLQYMDQPKDEWLLVAMESIADSDGDLFVFYIIHAGGVQWLRTRYNGPGSTWHSSSSRWVFCRK